MDVESTTFFDPRAGHPGLQQRLQRMIEQKRLPHALLFYGPEGCGKDRFALSLAQRLNCQAGQGVVCGECAACQKIARFQHPDVRWIVPTPAESKTSTEELAEALKRLAENPYARVRFPGKNVFIGIDTVRELKREAALHLSEGKYKIFVFSQAEQLGLEAANALLKLLEEPPPHLLLILITSNVQKLLPTIRSRCQSLRFPPLEPEKALEILQNLYPAEPPEKLALVARLSQYNLKKAQDFLEEELLSYRELAVDFLRKVVLLHRSHELMALLEPFSQTRQREYARHFLWFLLLWFQDVLYLKSGGEDPTVLNNPDLMENLQRFIRFLPEMEIIPAVELVDQAIRALEDVRNFSPILILLEVAIKLNQVLKKQTKS